MAALASTVEGKINSGSLSFAVWSFDQKCNKIDLIDYMTTKYY